MSHSSGRVLCISNDSVFAADTYAEAEAFFLGEKIVLSKKYLNVRITIAGSVGGMAADYGSRSVDIELDGEEDPEEVFRAAFGAVHTFTNKK